MNLVPKSSEVHVINSSSKYDRIEMKRLIENVMISWRIIATSSYSANENTQEFKRNV